MKGDVSHTCQKGKRLPSQVKPSHPEKHEQLQLLATPFTQIGQESFEERKSIRNYDLQMNPNNTYMHSQGHHVQDCKGIDSPTRDQECHFGKSRTGLKYSS